MATKENFAAFNDLSCPKSHPTKLILPQNGVAFTQSYKCTQCHHDSNQLILRNKNKRLAPHLFICKDPSCDQLRWCVLCLVNINKSRKEAKNAVDAVKNGLLPYVKSPPPNNPNPNSQSKDPRKKAQESKSNTDGMDGVFNSNSATTPNPTPTDPKKSSEPSNSSNTEEKTENSRKNGSKRKKRHVIHIQSEEDDFINGPQKSAKEIKQSQFDGYIADIRDALIKGIWNTVSKKNREAVLGALKKLCPEIYGEPFTLKKYIPDFSTLRDGRRRRKPSGLEAYHDHIRKPSELLIAERDRSRSRSRERDHHPHSREKQQVCWCEYAHIMQTIYTLISILYSKLGQRRKATAI